ncbi:MAG: undecaprenyldiphospho-muramoylpentapeptide beta-N-acetylglucosaminyltransferase [Candidatus Methylacidiphilales bacterium]|nr:undecaprenyldiphospho-muramoylpentapeptide beta-N-acetylglucosaminyltransferase [Candidatus Methylacidiphilales bacterium]
MSTSARICIACGGTGGHLFPGLAVAEELRRSGHQVRLYVSNKEIDRRALAAYPEFERVALPVLGWPGLGPRTPSFFVAFWKAYRQSVAELREYTPDAVLGMGGFTSAPILLAASRRRIPTLLHESNAIPGKVTRWMASRSTRVLLGFSECAAHLEASVLKVTGTPVRSTLKVMDRREAAAEWGLDPDRFTIAVMGGSQGAAGLNRLVARAAAEWKNLSDKIQIIHLAGPQDVNLLHYNYQRDGIRAEVRDFCDRMETVYSLADAVVARSGASSLTELAFYRLPSFLVPYPHAAEDHQTRNAQAYAKGGAARVARENDEGSSALARWIRELMEEPGRREVMASAAGKFQTGGAAARVAREVEDALF